MMSTRIWHPAGSGLKKITSVVRVKAGLLMLLIFTAASTAGWAVSWDHLQYPGAIKCLVIAGRYVWIGGENGAWRFDSKNNYILPFTEEITITGESIALSGRIVKDIAVDNRGRIWFACWHEIKQGGGAGVSVFDGVGWHSFTEEDGLAGNDVLSISCDTSGRIWVGTTKGLSIYFEGTWTTFTQADGLMRNDPVELYADRLGRIWCGFWRGVNVNFREEWWTWERGDVDYVYGITEGKDNKIYCATKGGLAVWDGVRWERVLNRGDLRRRLISSLVIDDSGNIWCAWGGLPKGASVFDGDRWARVTSRNTGGGLASDRIMAIGKDGLGRLWFAARDGEISVMIPDGAPGIDRSESRSSSLWFPDEKSLYAYASLRFAPRMPRRGIWSHLAQTAETARTDGLLPFLRVPSMLGLGGSRFSGWGGRRNARPERFPIPNLAWEEPLKQETTRPVLVAQAGQQSPKPGGTPASATTQIQIVEPAGLMEATKENPFALHTVLLDVEGMIGSTEKIDKVEVNGFRVTLRSGISLGNQNFYNFKGSVMTPGITAVRVELFRGDQSLFAQEYPVIVPAKEPEQTPPDLYFIDPRVPPEDVIAARSGKAEKIRIQLSLQQRGEVKGIASDDTGVKEVRVSGELAFMQAPAPSQIREHGITRPEGAKYFEHTFPLKRGPNPVSIEAFDYFGNVAPLTLDLFVQELLSDSIFYDSSWAFIVGIDNYKYWPPLSNAVRDAKGMRNLFVNTLNFPEEHIIEVYNEEATHDNILREFNKLSAAGKSDRVVIFFACHGHTQPSRRGDQGFLIPTDGVYVPGKQPTLDQVSTWISMEDLSRQLGLLSAKHILLIVDACYSGLVFARRGAQLAMIRQDQVTARFLELAEEMAIEVITAGDKDEQVADGGYKNHSVFTGFLIRGLERGEADLARDGVITAEELGTYVWQNVQEVTGNKQHPRYCKLPGYEHERGTVLFVVPRKSM